MHVVISDFRTYLYISLSHAPHGLDPDGDFSLFINFKNCLCSKVEKNSPRPLHE